MVLQRGKLFGVEIKRTDTPKLTPSIRDALQDLKLERVAIVHPGAKRYPLDERVEAVPLAAQGSARRCFTNPSAVRCQLVAHDLGYDNARILRTRNVLSVNLGADVDIEHRKLIHDSANEDEWWITSEILTRGRID